MPDLTLLGLPTCDTCRKARKALEADGHTVTLRDVRADPLSEGELAALLAAHGDALVNRKSATWRGLTEAERAAPPVALLAAHPALMKRPVIVEGAAVSGGGGGTIIGTGRHTLGWSDAIRAGWA